MFAPKLYIYWKRVCAFMMYDHVHCSLNICFTDVVLYVSVSGSRVAERARLGPFSEKHIGAIGV